MTVVDPDTTTVGDPPREVATRRDPLELIPPSLRPLLIAVVFILLLTAAEQITDQGRLTSANTWTSALQLTIPIALAGLGGLWAERAGIINIGLEGMMILGTWMGAWGCIEHGAWAGVLLGVAGGAIGGLVHAVATVGFGVDHIVSGVAINILGAGATRFLNLEVFDSTNQSPSIPENVPRVRIPGLNDLVEPVLGGTLTDTSVLAWLALSTAGLVLLGLRRPGDDAPDWARPARAAGMAVLIVLSVMSLIELAPWLDEQKRFGISETGRIVRGITDDLSLVTVIGVLTFPISGLVLWRTTFGLRLRSVGEDPVAAESLGVNVYLMKVVATTISGALAGLGGVSLVYVFANQFRAGQTNGRGYIGLAAMIFGNWRPAGLAAGAGLFGLTDALSIQSGETTRALLLVVAMAAGLLALRAAYTGRWRSVVVTIVGGLIAVGWFSAIDELPNEVVTFLPHLATLLVLTFASQRLRPPAADGKPYRRGDAG